MEAVHVSWRPLGELIVERGLITQEQLEDALVEQRVTRKRLGTILVGRGIVSAQELTSALVDQIGVEDLLDEFERTEDSAGRSFAPRIPAGLRSGVRRFREKLRAVAMPAARLLTAPFVRLGAWIVAEQTPPAEESEPLLAAATLAPAGAEDVTGITIVEVEALREAEAEPKAPVADVRSPHAWLTD